VFAGSDAVGDAAASVGGAVLLERLAVYPPHLINFFIHPVVVSAGSDAV
jgi:hypothetical protein